MLTILLVVHVAGVRCCSKAGGTKASAPISAMVVVQPSVKAHDTEHIPETPKHTRRVAASRGQRLQRGLTNDVRCHGCLGEVGLTEERLHIRGPLLKRNGFQDPADSPRLRDDVAVGDRESERENGEQERGAPRRALSQGNQGNRRGQKSELR